MLSFTTSNVTLTGDLVLSEGHPTSSILVPIRHLLPMTALFSVYPKEHGIHKF